MVKMRCKYCGFVTEREIKSKGCPNCDREGLEREKSADELLNSVDE